MVYKCSVVFEKDFQTNVDFWVIFFETNYIISFKIKGESDLVWHEISSIFSRGMRELPILKVIFKNLVYPFVSPEKNWSIF